MRKVKLADGLVHDAYDTQFTNWCDTVCRLQDYNQDRDRTAGTVMAEDEPVTCLACVGRAMTPDMTFHITRPPGLQNLRRGGVVHRRLRAAKFEVCTSCGILDRAPVAPEDVTYEAVSCLACIADDYWVMGTDD